MAKMADVDIKAHLESLLAAHPDVAGVSIGLLQDNYTVSAHVAGYARISTGEAMTSEHFLECASLSKTVATAFAIEYFAARGIEMNTSVNALLAQAGSTWRIDLPPLSSPSCPSACSAPSWPDKVTLAMLVNHTALGMHYVYGMPLGRATPSPQELLDGSLEAAFGYAPLYIEREPGSLFKYSGGGFIVLQHLIECLEKQQQHGGRSSSGGGSNSIGEITKPFLEACDMADSFCFDSLLPEEQEARRRGESATAHTKGGGGGGGDRVVAFGHLTRESEVAPLDGGRLAFPAFAAGAICTPTSLASFLGLLARAYNGNNSSSSSRSGISTQTARLMLGEESLHDLGAVDFMRARVGLGVFVATAGPNSIMIHQAANEGFRGVYMVCFDGPDAGKGFVLLCNGDNAGVLFQAEVCVFLLSRVLSMQGMSFAQGSRQIEGFREAMRAGTMKQAEIVNLGLKELVLAGFHSREASSSRSKL